MDDSDGVKSRIKDRWDSLVKPPGSLGDLETLVQRLGAVQGRVDPDVEPAALLLFAGDHGVTEENVSAYPASVTATMLETIREGGAAINTLCESAGLELHWYNVGAASDLTRDGEKLADGTSNMVEERALDEDDLESALECGRRALRNAVSSGKNLVALGEIGIGNTTASSAVAGAILNCEPEDVVGPGTGVKGNQLEHKSKIVAQALNYHDPDGRDGYDVLGAVGGYELAAQAGVILEARRQDVPVLLDGFITGASALAACRIDSAADRVLFASHRSREPAHRKVLEALDLEPMIDLNLRLGEGSGAAVVYPIIKSAMAAYRGMHTFEDAGITVG